MKRKFKRIVSVIICLALVSATLMSTAVISASALTYSGSASYKSGKYYTALTKVTLTGNQRTDIVNVAKSQIGYQEGGSSSQLSGEVRGNANCTEYGRWYGLQDMWCAMFVSWCANVAGVSTSIVPKHSYTPSGLSWFKNKGQAYSRATVANGGYTPQAGDIIYFKSGRNSNPTNHIGIVTSYSGGKVYTVEGNTSSATVSTNGGAVAAKSYSITNTYIVYICKPAYKNTSTVQPTTSAVATEGCYPACDSSYTTLISALESIGVDSSFSFRTTIAAANGITDYSGTVEQNNQLLSLLKAGKLVNPTYVPTTPSNKYFKACDASYTTITTALDSIGVDSSFSFRTTIAAANGITDYSGTVEQNTQMLNLLKEGKLINPSYTEETTTAAATTEATESTAATETTVTEPAESTVATEVPTSAAVTYFPACDSSYTTISTALASIGVDNSLTYRKKIAAANGITDYTGTAEQNIQMLNLLKSGKLIKPADTEATTATEPPETTIATQAPETTAATQATETTATEATSAVVTYFPACDPSYNTISTALASIGVDNSFTYRTTIAAANGIADYSGTVEQNTQMLNLLKAGKLINPSGSVPSTTVPSTEPSYTSSPKGDGKGIYAYGVDISKWQADGIDFAALKEGGIDFVIIRAGYRTTTDPYFEYNYYAAKEAGLDVGAYWYSYATTADGALSEAEACANVISGKKFEYPIYFDFEDSTQTSLSTATKKAICNAWLKNMADRGYLVGLYSMYSQFTGDLNPATITPEYESWVARYLNSGTYASYADYHSKYGMWQYTSTGSVSGYSGNIDRNVSFKDYPSIVKKNGYNGYSTYSIDDFAVVDIGTGFYATITDLTGKALAAGSTAVETATLTKDSSQLWKFEYQNDGTYKLKNASNGKYLELTNSDTSGSAVVQTAEASENDTQNWYLIENTNSTYSLMPVSKVAEGTVLDISSDGVISLTVSSGLSTQKLNITNLGNYLLGDVNRDGNIDVSDATEIQKIITALVETNSEIDALADVSLDGRVDIKDATLIQMYLAGLIRGFGGGSSEPTTEPATEATTEPPTEPTTSGVTYFPACDASYTSLSPALASIGVDNSLAYRKTIAAANGFTDYTGTAEQNTQMLNLLKQGKLIVP